MSTTTIFKIAAVITEDNKDERVLLIKEKVEKNDIAKWNIVKGTCEPSRETLEEAVIRECQEEISTEVKLRSVLSVSIVRKKESLRVQVSYLAKIKSGIPEVKPKDFQKKLNEEISEIRWFSRAEIESLNPNEFVSRRTKLILEQWLSGKSYPLEIIHNLNEE